MSRILIPILLSISLIGGLLFFIKKPADNFFVFLVPHNDIYQSKILQLIDSNYRSNIKTIIVLGTNHRDIGPPVAQSGDDYSIQNIIPVINKIYPDAEVVSYIIRPGHDIQNNLSFSNSLKKGYDPRRTLIIASVDFSHYTSRSQADTFDQETIRAINQSDYNQLIAWGPEHTDCPDCIIISSILGPKFTLTDKEYSDGTSYFFGYFQ